MSIFSSLRSRSVVGRLLLILAGLAIAVPVFAQIDTSQFINTTQVLTNLSPSLLTFDRTTCLNICEETGRSCPSTDRTCGDTYITCRSQCYQGVSATPAPTAIAPKSPTTQVSQPVAPTQITQVSNTGDLSGLYDRIAALEALITRYIGMCSSNSCCSAPQPTQTQISYYTAPEPAPTTYTAPTPEPAPAPAPAPAPTLTLNPNGTVAQPGTIAAPTPTQPTSCKDCLTLTGTAKTQCETTFKCITLVSPSPTLPTTSPTPSVSTNVGAPPAGTVPGVGTAPGGISLPGPSIPSTSFTPSGAAPMANYFTPYQSWSDACKAACQANSLLKTQAQKDQCKVDNCSVTQYKSACSAYCKANNTNSTFVSQCMAQC